MYCRNCGKKINENAVVCLHCGCELSPKGTINKNNRTIKKGKGIASMILGIVAFLLCFSGSFLIFGYTSYVSAYNSYDSYDYDDDYDDDYYDDYYNDDYYDYYDYDDYDDDTDNNISSSAIVTSVMMLAFIIVYIILSIVGLCLAIFERKHNKNTFNTVGFWLNLVVIIISIIHIICWASTLTNL